MRKAFQKALFIFRRDHRLEDNSGLIFALQSALKVIPAFIFTPEQIQSNPYFSERSLQFLVESLEDLDLALSKKGARLYLFYDEVEKVLLKCIEKLKIDLVVVNEDYTPYSQIRDQKMHSICEKKKVAFFSFEDLLLHSKEETLKKDHTPYTVFTPFFKHASTLKIRPPLKNPFRNYEKGAIAFAKDISFCKKILPQRQFQQKGGRKEGLKILKDLKKFDSYISQRDFPAIPTTHLSPHLKYTTLSPREVYFEMTEKLGKNHPLVRSLYWRDFFTQMAFHFPHVFEGAFHKKFNRLKWSNNKIVFQKWCEGKTGVPIVDAGMRELNQTGFMHNRVRMIVASFLIKDLHINWQWGEKAFANALIDYDPSVNNGNWQWVAGTGCDHQPYFRIFNPWSQAKKFDPQCLYIKKWVPELNSLPPKAIHEWFLEKNQKLQPSYPLPMVDHAKEAKRTLQIYKKVAKSYSQ